MSLTEDLYAEDSADRETDLVPVQLPDPFDLDEDASRADVILPRKRQWKAKPTVDLFGKPPRKEPADLNPLQRRWFERNGYTYARVEHANAWGAVTVDLWGIADYLACRPGEIVLVQVTTPPHAAEREKKARRAPELAKWLEAGGRFWIALWDQPAGPGTSWRMRVRELTC